MEMRESRLLRKLRAGETVIGCKTNLTCSRVVELAALAGFECVWTDMEHVPNDLAVVEKQILAAKAHGIDLLVRVARGGYSDYIRPLELDAAGIMVPHVMSAEDARNVARITRFHPLGRRPVDGGNADGAFCGIPYREYIAQANARRFVILQIEDPEPLDELDGIASVPGIDMIFFGPGDFTHGIGAPGNFDDPRVEDARRRVVETALRHGKFAGTSATPETAAGLAAMGYRYLNVAADVLGLADYFAESLRRAYRDIETPPAKP